MSKLNGIRTTGAKHQWQYDNLLSDLDITSLKFLSWKYNNDLRYFPSHNNLNDQENAQSYKEIQQRKKMIDEEIRHREEWENVYLDYLLEDE
jgi:hypothetical protein